MTECFKRFLYCLLIKNKHNYEMVPLGDLRNILWHFPMNDILYIGTNCPEYNFKTALNFVLRTLCFISLLNMCDHMNLNNAVYHLLSLHWRRWYKTYYSDISSRISLATLETNSSIFFRTK